MIRIDKITQDEIIKNSELYNKCSYIYCDKFFYEDDFSLDDVSDLVFFLYYLNDEMIGFGTYQENSVFFLTDSIFIEDYIWGDHHKDLVKHIISEINSIKNNELMICAYQSEEEDRDMYFDLGFTLYKDFAIQSPDMFVGGYDLTRFVLELG